MDEKTAPREVHRLLHLETATEGEFLSVCEVSSFPFRSSIEIGSATIIELDTFFRLSIPNFSRDFHNFTIHSLFACEQARALWHRIGRLIVLFRIFFKCRLITSRRARKG